MTQTPRCIEHEVELQALASSEPYSQAAVNAQLRADGEWEQLTRYGRFIYTLRERLPLLAWMIETLDGALAFLNPNLKLCSGCRMNFQTRREMRRSAGRCFMCFEHDHPGRWDSVQAGAESR